VAKILRTVATIAGVVTAAASFVAGVVTGNPALIATASKIAKITTAIAITAAVGSSLLTKPPPISGSMGKIVIEQEGPMPYLMGQSYTEGSLIFKEVYGRTRDDAPNPYRSDVMVLSCAGPIQSVGAIYSDYDYLMGSPGQGGATAFGKWFDWDAQVGNQPETTRLHSVLEDVDGLPIPGWGSTAKLSGLAAIMVNLWWDGDPDDNKWSGGVPSFGVVASGVKVYDPRLDSTRGGSGSHRIDDETTWTYSRNVALHALTYLIGRYKHGQEGNIDYMLIGIGLTPDYIDIPAFARWATTCDLNGWTVNGIIYERGEKNEKFTNLKAIMASGSGVPVFSGAGISVIFQEPRVSVVTITEDDLGDGPCIVPNGRSLREYRSKAIARFRSPANEWSLVSNAPISIGEAGEKSREEYEYPLVTSADQADELTTYNLLETRETAGISLPLKPHFIDYPAGTCVTINIPRIGLSNVKAIITTIDPNVDDEVLVANFQTENDDKHDRALGLTAITPPPITTTSIDEDLLARRHAVDLEVRAVDRIRSSSAQSATITLSDATVTISAHQRVYSDKIVTVSGGTVDIPSGAEGLFAIYYDDPGREGGDVEYQITSDVASGQTTSDNPARHFVGLIDSTIENSGVPATPPSQPPVRVPAADNVGGFTASEIAEQLARTTKEQLAEIVGDTVLENGTDLVNINDLIKAITIRRREDAVRNGNENFDLGFTGWVSDTGDYLDAWPTSVESGSLVLTDGTLVTAEDTPYEQEQGAEFARLIRGRANT
jgi:hypothetical protein